MTPVLVGHQRFVDVAEDLALAHIAVFDHRQVVGTEDHVLGRDGDRRAVGGL